MQEVCQFRTSFVLPSEEEISEGIHIARDRDCIVCIHYFVPYRGNCKLYISPDSTLENCLDQLHRRDPIT